MSEVTERSPIASEPLSVVLLAAQPGPELDEVVKGWQEFLTSLNRSFEIFLVPFGCREPDPSLGERFPQVRVLSEATTGGPGDALKSALVQAQFPLLFYTLADKHFKPADLNKFLEKPPQRDDSQQDEKAPIDQVDLLSGFRGGEAVPWWLRLWDFFFRWFNRIIFGLPLERRSCWLGWSGLGRRLLASWIFGVRLHDPECVFRLFRRELFRRIPIQSHGSFVHVEVLAKANFLGALMADFPVAHGPETPLIEPAGSGFFREAYRLFRHGDFGPPFLLEVPPPSEPMSPVVEEVNVPNF